MFKEFPVIFCIIQFCAGLDISTARLNANQSSKNSNPRLSFMPMPDTNDGSTLIWLRSHNYQNWKNILLKDLDKYYHPKPTENVTTVVCTHNRKPTKGQVCDVDVQNWGICSQQNNFHYHRSAPCVFLKLNGLTDGWQPEYYNNTDDLPFDMPPELKHHIIHEVTNPPERNTVWVSCEGNTL